MNYQPGCKPLRLVNLLLFSLLLVACSSQNTYAPVVDIATIQPLPASGKQRVRHGESIYQTAWKYGLDYRELAERNDLPPPYKLRVGQQIYLKGKAPSFKKKKVVVVSSAHHKRASVSHVIKQREPQISKRWMWPAQGRIVRGYAGLNKGLNIANHFATPVYATNGGQVVYSGNGLRAYGNLIIIKHNNEYMSAYAHNSRVLIKEGDVVKKGEKIAEMGSSGTDKVMLHFEIRRNGKPVNPMKLLKS